MLAFLDARHLVINESQRHFAPRTTLQLPTPDALGHILAEEIRTDREYPPFDRSTRDGYAVRSAEAQPNSTLRCVGEIKAGDTVHSPSPPARASRS